jgi:hypothetical protein
MDSGETRKSPLRLQNSWEGLPGETQFSKKYFNIHKKKNNMIKETTDE